MTERSITHATFVIERTYPVAAVAACFVRLPTRQAKSKWFVGPDEWERGQIRDGFPRRRPRAQ